MSRSRGVYGAPSCRRAAATSPAGGGDRDVGDRGGVGPDRVGAAGAPWSPVAPPAPGLSPAGVVGGTVVGVGRRRDRRRVGRLRAAAAPGGRRGAGGGAPAVVRAAVGRGTGLVAVAVAVGRMIGLPVVPGVGAGGVTVT